MRRLVGSQLEDEFGEIRLKDANTVGLESRIQFDLCGGHRFDLDDVLCLHVTQQTDYDTSCLIRVGGPMHVTARRSQLPFKLLKVGIEMLERFPPNGSTGAPECLPVRLLRNQQRSFALNHVGCMSYVLAQLRVVQQLCRRTGKRLRLARVDRDQAHREASDARISAMCIVRTGEFPRCSLPCMCIRQELSHAVQTSASVLKTAPSFSSSIAVETAAFFTAKVPPNPQQRSEFCNSTRSIPRTLRSS